MISIHRFTVAALVAAVVFVAPAAHAAEYQLSVSSASTTPGGAVDLEVRLSGGASRVAALAFVLEYDAARLHLAAVDGIDPAQSVQFSVPAPFVGSAFALRGAGRFGLSVYRTRGPITTLADGTFARIRFNVDPGASGFAFVRVAASPAPNASDADQNLLDAIVSPSDLSGVAIAPQRALLDITPAALDFGNVPQRTTVKKTIVLTNVGTARLEVDHLQLGSGSQAFSILTPLGSPRILNPGQSFPVDVAFRSDQASTFLTRLYIDYATDSSISATVPVSAITAVGTEMAYVSRQIVPAVTSNDASSGGTWRSSLSLFNNDELPASVRLTLAGSDGSTRTAGEIRLAPHETRTLDDVIGDIFGLTSASGALVVDASSSDLTVRSTMYHQLSSGGRLGQALPSLPWASMIHTGEQGELLGLERNVNRNSNIGLVNFTATPATIRAEVRSSDGTVIGSKEYVLRGGEVVPRIDLFDALSISNASNLTVLLSAATADATFLGYASTLDETTGAAVFQSAR